MFYNFISMKEKVMRKIYVKCDKNPCVLVGLDQTGMGVGLHMHTYKHVVRPIAHFPVPADMKKKGFRPQPFNCQAFGTGHTDELIQ